MITTDDVEAAVTFLRDNAGKVAEARANRLYLEQWIKTVRADRQVAEIKAGSSAAAAEAVALSSQEYKDSLEAYRDAVKADERFRFLTAAAEARIEAWRTMESTRRAEGKAYG